MFAEILMKTNTKKNESQHLPEKLCDTKNI